MGPSIRPGVAGIAEWTMIDSDAAALGPQAFTAATLMFPLAPFAVARMFSTLEAPFQPAGRDHAYDSVSGTAVMEYVSALAEQIMEGPLTTPGAAGTELFTMTGSVAAGLVPHELDAVTGMSPLSLPAVITILLVLEVPVQPFGRVHEYVDAEGSAVTE